MIRHKSSQKRGRRKVVFSLDAPGAGNVKDFRYISPTISLKGIGL